MASEPRQGLREGSHGLFLSTVGRQKKAWLPQPWRALLSAAQGGQGGWDGIGKRVVFLAFAGLWFFSYQGLGSCGERERLMGVPT